MSKLIDKFVEFPNDYIPNAFGVDEPTGFSPFFIFAYNETFQVLQSKWFFWLWVKNCWKTNSFKKTNGVGHFFVPMTFTGRFKDAQASLEMEAEALKEIKRHRFDTMVSQYEVKAFINTEAKHPSYDFVLGELNSRKQIVNIYRCKRTKSEPLTIIRETKIATRGGTKITANIVEKL